MTSRHSIETVRDEVSRIQKSVDVLDAVVGEVRDRLERYFGHGRKMPEHALRGLARDIDATITAELRPIRRRIGFRKPTPVRPKSDAYEMLYLVVMPEDQLGEGRPRYFRLASMRIVATRKKVLVECMPTALGLRQHAAEKLIVRGADVMESVRNLALSLAGWAALPGLVDDVMEEAGFERMGITGCKGLLLGALDPRAPIPPGRRVTFGNGNWVEEDVPVSPLLPASFTINTYIGDREIQPNQRGAMAVIDQWRDACGEAFDLACEEVFWPEREIRDAFPDPIEDELVDDIRKLVVETRMLKAMGNAKIAGVRLMDLYENDPEFRQAPAPDLEEAEEEGIPASVFR